MDKTNVIWLSYHRPSILARGYWDQALLEDIFKQGDYEHFENVQQKGKTADEKAYHPAEGEGAIVIINGRTHIEDTEKINADIAKLAWCLFIITGDEEAQFPWREVKHPRMKVWVMLPRVNQHDDTAFKLCNGYRTKTREILASLGPGPRNKDFFFAGQVTHQRRRDCITAAEKLDGGTIITTQGFGEEKIDQENYLGIMSQSKVALCPSGPESPDSFRVYEALESGCIPIVDAYATNNRSFGFWRYLFGADLPFPVILQWEDLPNLLPELLRGYPHNANRIFAWWQQHKRMLKYRLIDDVKELSK